jgi:hypothetical protein
MIIDTPIDLIAGHDYILTASNEAGDGVPVTLKGPGGEVVITMGNFYPARGEEFRAQYSATYFVEYDDTPYVGWSLTPDCRGDLATLCHLAVNHTKDGVFQWDSDTDAFKVTLNRAYTYTFSMTGYGGDNDYSKTLTLTDSHGIILKQASTINDPLTTLTFHPSRTGTYYFLGRCGADDFGFSYTLTLRIKR